MSVREFVNADAVSKNAYYNKKIHITILSHSASIQIIFPLHRLQKTTTPACSHFPKDPCLMTGLISLAHI